METCKDCKWYEFYDGPEKHSDSGGEKAIMFCPKFQGGYYSGNTSSCSIFTPKPKPEKTCKDCEHYEFYDGPDKTCEGGKAGSLETVQCLPQIGL